MLTTEALAVARGRRRLATGVSVRVAAGEAIHLAGANGSGKTTTLRVLGGLLSPASGRVVRRGGCAFVPEKVALVGALRCDEWLEAMRRLRGRGGGAPARDWREDLAAAGLDPDVAQRPTGALSKGMLQRVALVEAFANGAALVLLDEPFSGLDPDGRAHLVALAAAHRRRGGAVVFTDHSALASAGLAPTAIWRLTGDGLHAQPADATAAPTDLRLIAAVRDDGERLTRHVPAADVDGVLVALIGDGWHVEEVRRA